MNREFEMEAKAQHCFGETEVKMKQRLAVLLFFITETKMKSKG